jgi:hypothetical protein
VPAGSASFLLAEAGSVADAILYEGYLLYPYRKSSPKNRVRWQFGVVAPRRWVEAQGAPAASAGGAQESWFQHTECLLEAGPSCSVGVVVRFLHMETRTVEERRTEGFVAVDELEAGGESHVTFDGAVPIERHADYVLGDLAAQEARMEVMLPAARSVKTLINDSRHVGRIISRRRQVRASVRVSATQVPARFPLYRLALHVSNDDSHLRPDAPRSEMLERSLIATHSMIYVDGGALLSTLEPPIWAAGLAKECRNIGAFPVLAGPPGCAQVILSSPIILYDHPRVAPESPGDLFDCTEIDEILSLRTLTLTDREKAEARATDPRAAEIVDRVDSLPEEILSRLHGAVRTLRPVRRPEDNGDRLVVAGHALGKGSRVILHPRRHGTDAQDIFVAGRQATVSAVLTDVDGTRFLAVTVDGDPRSELGAGPGRLLHFRSDEVKPLPDLQPQPARNRG